MRRDVTITVICKKGITLILSRTFYNKNKCQMLELLHTYLGFIFPKVFLCLLIIIESPIF
jgi:hypothetical protein